ncbi:ABC transporter substrate-binding protein [Rhodococcus pseudokoreensis]|uniref:ABC transporter substrate-binding protein n=1 Tax=Rhodococcus pseudokoreensis TaxID=2811421 RepID=A0A974W816_9NOCA|nr:ABC transporter substrate-binding protein [Rhodococcus pseudokoreensis]QSE92983.1 ABC transporter substrate-binding protein [Rhodococcus pseudokoreensis]
MIKSRARKTAIAGASSVVMLLAGCAGGGGNSADPGAAATGTCQGAPIRIAQTAPSFVYLPFYVAEGAGYFEQEGLVPESVEVHTGSGIVAAAVSGSVEVALVTAGEVYVARHEGAPVRAFAQVENLGTNVIIKKSILDDLGITENSSDSERLQALKGRRIGVTGSGSGSDQLIRYLAAAGGMDPDKDMEIIATGSGGSSVSGFTGDRFDAIAISSPQSDIALQQGQGTYLYNIANGDYKPLANNLYITAMASDRTIAQKSDVLECFTAALARAQKVIHEDPETAAKIAQPFLGTIDPTIYAEAFQSNLHSWPASPVIDDSAAMAALRFQNGVMGGNGLSEDLLSEAVDTDIATAATSQ